MFPTKATQSNYHAESLLPLSPRKDVYQDYEVYAAYLKQVFNHKSDFRIIAISGGFGIGKTSMLESFFQRYSLKYMNLSLGKFGFERDSRKEQELELELLRQIIARCKKSQIPYSTAELVPESKVWGRRLAALMAGATALCLYLLLFPGIQVWLPELARKIAAGCLGFFITVLCTWTAHGVFPHLKWKRLSFIGEKGGIKLSKHSVGHLDKYGFELAYVINSVGPSYGNIILFDDLDRLELKSCVNICSKLRDINRIINNRHEEKENPIQFVFTVNDEVLHALNDYAKFFDIIIPMYPTFGLGSIADKWKVRYLEMMGLEETPIIKKILKKAKDYHIYSLMDYRTAAIIHNEYLLLSDVEQHRDNSRTGKSQNWDPIGERFMFVVYKVLFPLDYHNIRINESVVYFEKTDDLDNAIDEYQEKDSDSSKYQLLRYMLRDLKNDTECGSPDLAEICTYYCGASKTWRYERTYKNVRDAYRNGRKPEEIWQLYVQNTLESGLKITNNLENAQPKEQQMLCELLEIKPAVWIKYKRKHQEGD